MPPDGEGFSLLVPVEHDPWGPPPGDPYAAPPGGQSAQDAQLAATMTHAVPEGALAGNLGTRIARAVGAEGAGIYNAFMYPGQEVERAYRGDISGFPGGTRETEPIDWGAGQALGMVGARGPFAEPNTLGAAGGRPGAPPPVGGIKAYHGSPYNFDWFDPSKIGTGEGAQAYGHGLYFAENPEVAEGYKGRLSIGNLSDPNDVAATYLKALSDRPTAIQALRDNAKNFAEGDAVSPDVLHQAADLLEKGVEPKPPGKVYEVKINAEPEHFLDWDKPLSEQSPKVQEAVASLEMLPGTPQNKSALTGREIHNSLPGTDEEASQKLHDAGIPGIKYLDQGSRGGGAGTRNYVVFNDQLIDIAKTGGGAAEVGAGRAAGGAGEAEPLASRVLSIYNPPAKTPRPFAEDYPHGAPSDAAGNLTADIEGRPLRARRVVGRRVVQAPDEPLRPEEYDALATDTVGGPGIPRPARLFTPGTLGTTTVDPVTGAPITIALREGLPADKAQMVYAHELGHAIDEIAGQIPTAGLSQELKGVYNTLNNPFRTAGGEAVSWGKPAAPRDFGYRASEAPREYIVEAIRAYMADPNYLKTVAPKTAAVIRAVVNPHPTLSKFLQFNVLPAAAVGSALVAGNREQQ